MTGASSLASRSTRQVFFLLAATMLAAPVSARVMPQDADEPVRRGQVSPDAGPRPLPPPAMPAGGPPGGMPLMASIADTRYSSAMTVVDGAYQPAQSIPAAVIGGKQGDTFASGITIASRAPNLNGIIIRGGKSAFTLSGAQLDLRGIGTSDFLGIGAGAMAVGAMVVLRDVRITTAGAVRTAVVAADGAVMKVYDSTLIAHGGPLPAGYMRKIGPGMMEAPAPLGISGTARTTLTMGRSESYFYNSTLIADGWGALSTDATGGYVYLEANDCEIRVTNSGYGAYADGGAHVVLNRTKVAAATFTGIIAGDGEMRFKDVTGTAGKAAVMIHSVMGSPAEVATLRITGGRIATGDVAILVKSANADIVLDHANLIPANGILLQSIVNDDANRTKVDGGPVTGIVVRIRNGSYAGSIIHGDAEREMSLTMTSASLTGAIQNVTLALGDGGKWTATANSIVTFAAVPAPDQVDAPHGVIITATGSPGIIIIGRRLRSGGMLAVK